MLFIILRTIVSALRSRRALALENLALRHQLDVLQRGAKRPRLTNRDRTIWIILSRLWTDWGKQLVIVQPETVVRWHREGFRLYWRWKSRPGRIGRPQVPNEVRELIRNMSRANSLWGATRIHGELLKLGFEVSQASVSKYAAWTGQQIVEAFPWNTAPKYLIRDRDGKFGEEFIHRVESMSIEQALISARSPWQNPYVERLIGSIRRECLDYMIILNKKHLRRVLNEYFCYYHESRTHLGLEKDCPQSRPVEPPELGPISAEPMVGGLHHRYCRRAD